MTEIIDIRRTIQSIITSIRLDIVDGRRDLPLSLNDRAGIGERVERVRVMLLNATRVRLLGEDDKFALVESVEDLISVLGSFDLLRERFRFRSSGPGENRGVPDDVLLRGDIEQALTLALHMVRSVNTYDAVDGADLFSSAHGNLITKTEASRRLNSIVPEDVVSPVRFDFVDRRLVVVHSPAVADQRDQSSVASARAALIEQGERVLESLRISNCDKRLFEVFEKLHEKLAHAEDVVQLGVLNISCEHMAGSFKEELPTAVESLVRAHSSSISLYVAHFPEWRTFSEKALLLDLSSDDIEDVKAAALKISDQFERNAENIDEEVPRTIRYLASLIDDPLKVTKRTGSALITSLENLLAKLFSVAAEFLGDTVKKTSEALSTWTARIVVAFVVSTALAAGAELTPVFSKFQTTAWVQKAMEVLNKVELKVE
ncbi:hypothetical protein GGI64_006399 [Rhizobium leguminosarum]|uniref:Uncharacterized protein n=1 Tax=Rhizobium leguminosarum TaxID=384 RepID=A0A7Z0E5J7_RHILE|nr:hypothetical protein [Rhizobium leguminosarum]NYJ15294.1 hypothetical protein [Rhizobium leguminosarum]